MKKQLYEKILIQVELLAGMVLPLKLTEALEAINKCETVAPLVNPTAWIKGNESMYATQELIEALKVFQDAVKKHNEKTVTKLTGGKL